MKISKKDSGSFYLCFVYFNSDSYSVSYLLTFIISAQSKLEIFWAKFFLLLFIVKIIPVLSCKMYTDAIWLIL